LNTDAVIDVVEYAAYQPTPIAEQVLALLTQHRFNRLPIEGTLYRQTWQSTECTAQGTPLGTAMIGVFCQQPESLSRFHKLTYDEVWHHYQGDALELFLIHPDGFEQQVILGQAIGLGELTQFVVPAGVWQAGRVVAGGSYALYGCTMAPGFHIECFQAATATELCAKFPQAKAIIEQLAIADGDTEMHSLPPAKKST
jgi:predicted cupin superfamily sugar epimerase